MKMVLITPRTELRLAPMDPHRTQPGPQLTDLARHKRIRILVPKKRQERYVVVPLRSALRRCASCSLVFGSDWTQIGPKFIARLISGVTSVKCCYRSLTGAERGDQDDSVVHVLQC